MYRIILEIEVPHLGMTPIPKHLSKIKMVATDYLLRVVALYLVLDNEAIL